MSLFIKVLVGSVLLFSFAAQAREVYEVGFLSKIWIVEGDLNTSTGSLISSVTLKDVTMRLKGERQEYLIAVQLGWGSQPLNELCYELFGEDFSYASSYGQVAAPGWFDNHFVVFEHDGRGVASSYFFDGKDAVSVYYENLQCSSIEASY